MRRVLIAVVTTVGFLIGDPAHGAGPQSIFPGSRSAGTEDSRTKPVSAPLSKDSMNLQQIPFRIVHESYCRTAGRSNWELFIMNADGSNKVNLTNTPRIDEMYPHVSPDGTKICFVADEGSSRNKVRHVYYMDIDGKNRVHVARNAREPCWCFDSESIAYLKGEYERYTTREYATSGLMFYQLKSDWRYPHMNDELHHLYAICWSPDSRWFLGVVHGGMEYSDTVLAFEAFGKRVFDLERFDVRGCRPDLSTDGTRMVWGETDWNLCTGEIDLTGTEPQVTNVRDILRCAKQFKVYHVDLSPDGKYVTFSYGPVRGGQQVGGMAKGWNICVGDLEGTWVQVTTDGLHNKEPDWVPIRQVKP